MSDSETPKLLPCPFCGEPCDLREDDYGYSHPEGWHPTCSKCACEMGSVNCNCPYDSEYPYKSKDEAIAAWNTRHSPPINEPIQKWQPIETAPRDGTWVLICRVNDGRPSIAYYNDLEDAFYDRMEDSFSTGGWTDGSDNGPADFALTRYEPTHWMPLPAKP